MDAPNKIRIVNDLNFFAIVDHFGQLETEFDINTCDEDNEKHKE